MISDPQWKEIKSALHRVGVNADTVPVGKLSLRDKLDRLNVQYAANRKPPPTMKQLRDYVNDTIEKIDALRSAFFVQEADQETGQKKDIATIVTGYAGDEEAAELRGMLDKVKANLRSVKSFDEARDAPEIVQRGQWFEMQQAKCGNAHKLTNEYWIALAKLWRRLVPQTTGKEVVTFVEIVTGAKPETIRSYLHRSGAPRRDGSARRFRLLDCGQ